MTLITIACPKLKFKVDWILKEVFRLIKISQLLCGYQRHHFFWGVCWNFLVRFFALICHWLFSSIRKAIKAFVCGFYGSNGYLDNLKQRPRIKMQIIINETPLTGWIKYWRGCLNCLFERQKLVRKAINRFI